MDRAAAAARADLKRRVDSLASVAASAALLGFLGTTVGIMFSFPGGSGDKYTMMKAAAWAMSQALVPTGLGLVVSLFALTSYRYLSCRLERADVEMQSASRELLNYFSGRGRTAGLSNCPRL